MGYLADGPFPDKKPEATGEANYLNFASAFATYVADTSSLVCAGHLGPLPDAGEVVDDLLRKMHRVIGGRWFLYSTLSENETAARIVDRTLRLVRADTAGCCVFVGETSMPTCYCRSYPK